MPAPVVTEEIIGAIPAPIVADSALEEFRQAREAALSPRGVAGVPTGFEVLDRVIGGLQTGLHILGAEPGAGKTALALNISSHAASKHGIPVVYASFDEVPERLLGKVVSARMSENFSTIANGQVDIDKIEHRFLEAAQEHRTLSFVHADAQLMPADMIQQMRDRMEQYGQNIGLLVIDYLQPWAAAMAATLQIEFRAAVGQMALELRKLANESRCPVLLVSAQNRSGQGSSSMTSLRESSDLEYGADSIMLLTKPDDVTVSASGIYQRKLFLAKNRYGPSSESLILTLNGKTQKITME